ncbi:MAG: flagellar basal-body MS-ring/collar protein FliF [Acidobacteriota bacterium]|nr:flagellar basal-body MS-ring/collar protein FliF [Acidobacteriota bacterium]
MADPEETGGTPARLDPRNVMSQLTTGQMISLGVIVVASLFLVYGIFVFVTREEMVPLYDVPMSAKGQVAIETELNTRGVEFQSTGDGRILVPQSKAMDLRTQFEALDMAPQSKAGMAMMDDTNPLKAGDYMIRMKARQAKGEEIEMMLEENPHVQKAKVEISPHKDSPFADETEPAKVSVMLRLKNYAELKKTQILGMQRMIAAAVEGANPDSVVITDQYGNQLTAPPSDDDSISMSQSNLGIKAQMERDMEGKIHEIVETFLGPGKVKARVSLDVNFDQIQQIEKTFGGDDAEGEPQKYNEQSKTEKIQRQGPAGDAVGAAANTAQGQIPPAGEGAEGSTIDRETLTNQYYVNEQQVTTRQQPHTIERRSIALQLDYKLDVTVAEPPGFFAKLTKTQPDWIEEKLVPLTRDELDRIEELVKGATGFVEGKDFISIQNFEFKPLVSKKAQAAMETGLLFEYIDRWTKPVLTTIIFVIIMMVGFSLFRRFVAPILQQAQLEEPALSAALPSGPPKTVAELESELEAEIEASSPTAQLSKSEIMKKRLVEMVQQDPESVASLVRTWLLEDE